MQIRENLDKMKQDDIYSMALFILYKLQDTTEYSALSELAYILDKSNLLKLCEYFGGCTITIPTISELEQIIYALTIYKMVEVDKIDIDDAISEISGKVNDVRPIRAAYNKIHDVLDNYNFYSGE